MSWERSSRWSSAIPAAPRSISPWSAEKSRAAARTPTPTTCRPSPHWLPQKIVIPLIQTGLVKEPALPDVPLLLDQPVKPEDKPLLEFMSRSSAVGRPLGTTPGAPADRVAALRAAFTQMIKDKDFMGDANKHNMDIRPMSGEELGPADPRHRRYAARHPRTRQARDGAQRRRRRQVMRFSNLQDGLVAAFGARAMEAFR